MNKPTDLSAIPAPERPTEPPGSDRPTLVGAIPGHTAIEALAFILSRVERLCNGSCRDKDYLTIVKTFQGRLIRMKEANTPLTDKEILHYTVSFLARVNELLKRPDVLFSSDVRTTCAEIQMQVEVFKPAG